MVPIEEEEADRRREAAIASAAASLSPNFNPNSISKALSQSQARLSKFQELHKRRLQIKAKSKVNKRGDGKGKKTHMTAIQAHDQEPNKPVGESTVPIPENGVGVVSSMDDDNVAAKLTAKKRQKLHWGLDAKERWERKSNM